MQTFYVELGEFRYPIYVGAGLLDRSDLFISQIRGKQTMIVSNQTVAALYVDRVKAACQSKQCDVVILPDGEQHKNLVVLNQIFDELLLKGHTRTTTLLALGGGVIGDMTGFAAACYMRGVNYIQFPTTLLAQVDAAIGGKTAVNHALGKNLIGAFHQPRAVIADINTLQTLPDREFCAGIAEVIKYGLIQDADFFSWLEKHLSAILQKDTHALIQTVLRCCEIKASLVVADEREQNVRALLNLGHSFGHAIENGLGYGTWLHGEAVAVGLLMAADLSARMGWIPIDIVFRVKNLIKQARLPTQLPPELSAVQLLALMEGDKKNIHQRLRLVLLKAIGQAVVTEDVPLDELQQMLAEYESRVC